MDADRSIKTLKKDPILGPERSIQAVQVSKNGKNQLRNMTCLPEEFIYGWIFSLRSDSDQLTEYKKTCYRLLYNHFHGTITRRKDLLIEKSDLNSRIHELELSIKEKNDDYKELSELKLKRKKLNAELRKSDQSLLASQTSIED